MGEVVKISLEGLGEVVPAEQPREVPAGVVLCALRFLSKPGQFLDPRVQACADRSPTCAIATAWVKLRGISHMQGGRELSMREVANKLNIDEPEGVNEFISRLNSDIKQWLTFQGRKAGDLDKRQKVWDEITKKLFVKQIC